jgi:hypothetical protein
MSTIRNHKLFIPTLFFLVVVLSGLTLPVHHIHSIEVAPPISDDRHSDNHQHDAAETKNDAPSTYHEIHFVKLLSDDSFSASTCIDAFTWGIQFVAILPGTVKLFDSPSSETLSFSLKDPSPPPSQDKCVLFCSFLI